MREDEFTKKCSELGVALKCPCGHIFSQIISYEGVESTDQKQMGTERAHVWREETICPQCSKEMPIELQVYEYPEGILEVAFFYDTECAVLNKTELSKQIGIDIDK
jgi:hypothetical protein